ncbi:phosphoribosyl-ATP diphosphatase [Clostridium sp. MSJ-8]|uniref:phosphoribosyl-ATP diphosphatase n=1 Tax=Clostridium sp. MSJ-8 TaxID=2841510 RepID=UPI001C0EF43D|nr:phosphoribosyl-ATP diphosphatase [Clostridium sp. MSJ-8]MBU5487368.1 phosphoribosyl-ATP diphosphatase [Clostridium sp. MSJ-8]
MSKQLETEFNTILERKKSAEDGSYTAYLFNKGKEKILKKVGEEATEVVIASMADNKEELVGEICDLTYHVLVLMADAGLTIEDIDAELKKRREKSNNFKGERKPIENL